MTYIKNGDEDGIFIYMYRIKEIKLHSNIYFKKFMDPILRANLSCNGWSIDIATILCDQFL